MSNPDTLGLHIKYSEAPWDTAVFGLPVLQITSLKIDETVTDNNFAAFEKARDKVNACIVSCRLPGDSLRESMLLENHGFRFVETIFKPELDRLGRRDLAGDASLEITQAGEAELSSIMEIASTAFQNERFHIDPRLDSALGDLRYRNWVSSCLGHPSQKLYAVYDGQQLIAFFITEILADGTCYWHLTAVAPSVQGQGYGRRVWLAMLHLASEQGAQRVQTTITARNYRVLNLYISLGFHFPQPEMTFHWVREQR